MPVVLFLTRVGEALGELTLVGRLDPLPGRWHYRVPENVRFAPLPHYPSLARPLHAVPALGRSLGRFWRLLADVDAVWLLGPNPLAVPFALLARARGRRVMLGVRQDMPEYVRTRHPGRPLMHVAGTLLELAYRALARRYPVVVVGSKLARNYRRAGRLLSVSISLVSEADLADASAPEERSYDGELRLLSVGRLDAEKNPLLMADVLARVVGEDSRWRLTVCGEGPMQAQVEERLRGLAVSHRADMRGYVPADAGLLDVYRASHVFLHTSWTEGVPQVLFEAFAARVPVVATDVGGVSEAVGDAAVLVPPGDAEAAATAVLRVAGDPALRARLVSSGLERLRPYTIETRRVASFLEGDRGQG
jgi:glycosyltransferase involved in cell wall biosynthesis